MQQPGHEVLRLLMARPLSKPGSETMRTPSFRPAQILGSAMICAGYPLIAMAVTPLSNDRLAAISGGAAGAGNNNGNGNVGNFNGNNNSGSNSGNGNVGNNLGNGNSGSNNGNGTVGGTATSNAAGPHAALAMPPGLIPLGVLLGIPLGSLTVTPSGLP